MITYICTHSSCFMMGVHTYIFNDIKGTYIHIGMYLFRLFFGTLINNSQVLCKPQRRDTVLVVSALGAVDQATSYRTKTISFVVIIFIWFQF
jgi:hypothetical protein